MRQIATLLPLLQSALLLLISSSVYAQRVSSPAATQLQTRQGIRFTPNKGQIVDTDGELRPEIRYVTHSTGLSLYLADNRLSYVFTRTEGDFEHYMLSDGRTDAQHPVPVVHSYRMDLEFLGADPDPEIVTVGESSDYTNFYLEHCPQGIIGVRSVGRLTYRNVYPNIDFVIRGDGDAIKYDFVVRPGGRVSDIRLKYSGATQQRINRDGRLITTTTFATLSEEPPYSYAARRSGVDLEDPANRRPVASRYIMKDGIITFDVGRYDVTRTLVIDPALQWSTFYGGNRDELVSSGQIVELDRSGNAILVGQTDSRNFPKTNGSHYTQAYGEATDAFILKMNHSGQLQWATYYGGAGLDQASAVASDKENNLFVVGVTLSTRFPVLNAHDDTYAGNGDFLMGRDAFVIKFDGDGVRKWATYYGGGEMDAAHGIALDSSGNPAVILTTGSRSDIATSGSFDAVLNDNGIQGTTYDAAIVQFNKDGVRQWATYVGGTGIDYGSSAATDIHDNINITGATLSTASFPVTSGTHQGTNGGKNDAFVVRFSRSGQLLWGTYFGGPEDENRQDLYGSAGTITTDQSGNPIITGYTRSSSNIATGLQTAYAGQNDAFVAKFDNQGRRVWATYLGGSGGEVGSGIGSNANDDVLLAGSTASTTTFPAITPDGYQRTYGGGTNDAFVVRIAADGSAFLYGSFHGGNGSESGSGLSVDALGSYVVAGRTGTTAATFPLRNAHQGTHGGSNDVYMSYFCDIAARIDTSGPMAVCHGDSVELSVPPGLSDYLWQSGTDDNVSTSNSITVRTSGSYWVRMGNGVGCSAWSDTITVVVATDPLAVITPAGPHRFCQGDSVTLTIGPTTYSSYKWFDETLTTQVPGTGRDLVVKTSGTYRAIITTSAGCRDTTNVVTVTVDPKPAAVTISPAGTVNLCSGDSVVLKTGRPTSGVVTWSNGKTGDSIIVKESGTFTAMVINSATGCSSAVSSPVRVKVNPLPDATIVERLPKVLCEGGPPTILSVGNTAGLRSILWMPGGSTKDTIHVHHSAVVTLTVTDTNGCSASSSKNIVMAPRPKPDLRPDAVICQGDSVLLDAGWGYRSYEWSTGATSQKIYVRSSGRYFVRVVDVGDAACEGVSDTVTVNVDARPDVTLSGPSEVCANSSSRYSLPDVGGISYIWLVTGGGGSIIDGGGPADTSVNVRWGSSGSGIVRVTAKYDTSDCPASAEMMVKIGTSIRPTVAATPSTRVCEGDSVLLDAGTFNSYRWTDAAGNIKGTERRLWVKAPGIYKVFVQDAEGCSGESAPTTVSFERPPAPKLTIVRGSTNLCPGDTVLLDAGDHASYLWSDGRRTRTYPAISGGEYYVTVTNAAGCSARSDTITVAMQTPPAPVITGARSVCINTEQEYHVTTPGAGTFVWSISPAGVGTIVGAADQSTVRINWRVNGAAQIIVKEIAQTTGCEGESQPFLVTVETTLEPQITFDGSQPVFCHGESMVLRAPGYSSYLWKDGSNNTVGTADTLIVDSPGVYTVSVSAGSCTGDASITVQVAPPVLPLISPGGVAALCPGDSLIVTAEAGYPSYQWTRDGADIPGETAARLVIRDGGRYGLEVIANNGCSGESGALHVTMHPAAAIPTISVSGGELTSSPATTYQWSRNGEPIPGATGRSYSTTEDGLYRVTITDANGCSATSDPYQPIGVASATVGMYRYEGRPGEKILIPLTLRESANLLQREVGGFTARIRFNRTMLIPLGTLLDNEIDGNDRVITVAADLPQGFTGDSTTLMMLEFMVTAGNATETPLVLEELVWDKSEITTSTFDGTFRVKMLVEEGEPVIGVTTLMPPRPNPAAGVTQIEYEVIEDGRTQLLLTDMSGRTIVLFDAEILEGRYIATFDPLGLPSGSYLLVLQTATQRLTQNLTIQR